MPAAYLHGVETVEVERGPRPVSTVKSAVIALIGTAPSGPVGSVTLVQSEKDAAQFGTTLAGFSIPQALDAIFDHGAGTVLVINVLDPATHKTAVANEAITFSTTSDSVQLAKGAVSSLVVKNTAGTVTYVAGTDYTVDTLSGLVTRVSGGAIAAGATVNAAYNWADPSKVVAGDIIGSVNAAGVRTGIQALQDTYNAFGFFAKILIAPAWSTLSSVSTALLAMADKLKAMAYIDAPIGTTYAQAIAGRGAGGTINFNTSSNRARLCFPYVKVWDNALNAERLDPLSARAAGLRAKVDLENGFWWSSSNQEILGITGVERQLSAMIDDPNSEVNGLNAAGITTVFSSFGTGFRLWGNRTAAFPSVTALRNFENVRRTGDMINESLRYFSLQFVDMPINQALIDALLESANGYGRKLIGDGALLGFKAWYDVIRNPLSELSAGHLLISYKYTPPPPMERLTFESEITSEYLVTLTGGK